MRYSVMDFLVSSLLRWIFSEKHPLENAEYAPGTFVQLLINAAQAKDYVETISSLDPGLPNVDTLFWRLSECASMDLILREYKKVVKRNIEAVKEQIRRRRFIIATDYYVKELLIFVKSLIPIELVLLDRGFYAWGVINALQELKLGYIILVPKYARFFATNIQYEKIFRYVRYYKKRWGIETTFRVQDEVKIRTNSSIQEIRFALFVFECLLYNVWHFFKGRVPFRRFVNILFRMSIIKTLVCEVIALLTEKGFMDGKDPPPEKIYEEVIGKFGYIGRGSLHYSFNVGFLLFSVFFWRLIR